MSMNITSIHHKLIIHNKSTMFGQSFETASEGSTIGILREARPDRRSPMKRKRIFDDDHLTTSEDSLGKLNSKVNRKADVYGESPPKKERRVAKAKPKREPRPYLAEAQPKAGFEDKYSQLDLLGTGGFGTVFTGYRKADYLPVAIKYISKEDVPCKHKDADGNLVTAEIAVMMKLAVATGGKVGMSGSVTLLDWYDLGQELVLVMERPVSSVDLFNYMEIKRGPLSEEEAKVITKQLVDAAIELYKNRIFHRDIKLENILIETDSDVLHPRLIDFGLSCFFKKNARFHKFRGTEIHVPPELSERGCYKPGPTTVWQIGVALFEMLRRPVRFETDLFFKKSLKLQNMSTDCWDFLHKCLAQNPKRRPKLDELKLHPWLTNKKDES